MRIVTIVCLVFALAAVRNLRANSSGPTLSGVVTDRDSGAPIAEATISVIGNQGQKDEVTDSQGRFILVLVEGVKQGDIVRIRVQKSGYDVYDEQVSVSSLPLTPHLVRRGSKKAMQLTKGPETGGTKLPSGPGEKLRTTDGLTALYTPGPSSASARSVSISTSGVGRQEISIQARPKKLLFEPSRTVVEERDLPKQVHIGNHAITIVRFTNTGFTVDDHGMQGIVANVFVLEATPVRGSITQLGQNNVVQLGNNNQVTVNQSPALRSFSASSYSALVEELKNAIPADPTAPPPVSAIRVYEPVKESIEYASQITKAFRDAGWEVLDFSQMQSSISINGKVLATGIYCIGSSANAAAEIAIRALTHAGTKCERYDIDASDDATKVTVRIIVGKRETE